VYSASKVSLTKPVTRFLILSDSFKALEFSSPTNLKSGKYLLSVILTIACEAKSPTYNY